MSDYTSREALLEELNSYEKELYKDKRDAIDSDDEMMLFAIQNQETAISRITRSIMHSIPTVDEKEIIRKGFERVYKRMKAISYREESNDCDPFGDVPHYVVGLSSLKTILKEELENNE